MGYKLKTVGVALAVAAAFAVGVGTGSSFESEHGPLVSHVTSNDIVKLPIRFNNLSGPQQAALIAERLRRAGLTPDERAYEDAAVAHCLSQHGAPMYGWVAEGQTQCLRGAK